MLCNTTRTDVITISQYPIGCDNPGIWVGHMWDIPVLSYRRLCLWPAEQGGDSSIKTYFPVNGCAGKVQWCSMVSGVITQIKPLAP